MLRNIWKVGILGALVALALGGATFASAHGGGAARPHSFKIFDRTVASHNVDVDNSNSFSIGDEFIFTDQLWNVRKTHRLGTLHGVCTVVTERSAHCLETAHLHGSTLEGATTGMKASSTGAPSSAALKLAMSRRTISCPIYFTGPVQATILSFAMGSRTSSSA